MSLLNDQAESQDLKSGRWGQVIPTAVIAGAGGYAADYAAQNGVRQALTNSPLSQLLNPVTTVNGVTLDGVDAVTYGLGVAMALMPSLFGRHDLTVSSLGFIGGKAYRQYAATYNLPKPI